MEVTKMTKIQLVSLARSLDIYKGKSKLNKPQLLQAIQDYYDNQSIKQIQTIDIPQVNAVDEQSKYEKEMFVDEMNNQTKAQLWAEIKRRNLNGLITWRSPKSQMVNALTQEESKEESKEVSTWETKSKSQLWTEIKKRKLNKDITWKSTKSLMSDILTRNDKSNKLNKDIKDIETYNDLVQFVQQQKIFPITVRYSVDGQIRTIRILNAARLDNFEESLARSDAEDFKISGVSVIADWFKPYNAINRSKKGQGSDMEQIQEVDHENFYIPTSGNCLRKCLEKYYQLKGQDLDLSAFTAFCQKAKIIRDRFPQAKLAALGDHLGLTLRVYDKSSKKVRYHKNEKSCDLALFIYDGHYFWLKKPSTYSYDQAIAAYVKSDITIHDIDLDVEQYKPKINKASLTSQLFDVYAWDCETYKDPDNKFIPYAAAILPINMLTNKTGNILPDERIRQRIKFVKQFHKEDCLVQMINYLNDKHTKISYEKNGKTVTKKRTIYIYAHNAKGFDNVLLHEQKEFTFSSVIHKGGFMSLTIETENLKIVCRDSMSHLMGKLEKNYKDFHLPPEFCKKSCDHDSITKFNYMEKINEWKEYLDYDVIALSLVWIKYTQTMFEVLKDKSEEIDYKPESIDVRKCVSSASLAFAAFNKDNTIPLHQFKHPFAKQFIRNAVHGGRVCAYKKSFRSSVYHALSKFYQTTSIDEIYQIAKNKSINKIFANDDILMAFDATSLYPSAMKRIKSFPDLTSAESINAGFDINNNSFKHFIINCDIFLPESLTFIPVPYKIDGACHYRTGHLRNQYYTEMDIAQIIRFGGNVTQVHSGIGFTKSIDNPFSKFVNTFFELRKQYKKIDDEGPLQSMCKLILNSAYGKTVQKDISTKIHYTSQEKFVEIYDESIIDYQVLNNGQIMYEQKIEDADNSYPSILGCYILSESKTIMNDFIITTNSHINANVYYTDTDSIYIPLSLYQTLKDAGHVGGNLGQGKNDYGNGGIIYADFLGPKQKLCYTIEDGLIKKHVTFKGIEKNQQEEMDDIKFQQLGDQQLVQDQTQLDIQTTTVSRWIRTKTDGVYYGKDNITKKITALPQLKKFNLNPLTNNYQIIHMQ